MTMMRYVTGSWAEDEQVYGPYRAYVIQLSGLADAPIAVTARPQRVRTLGARARDRGAVITTRGRGSAAPHNSQRPINNVHNVYAMNAIYIRQTAPESDRI